MSAEGKRQTRWSRRTEERPAEIIAAALTLFAERGFAATKLDDVAKAAGISKGTVYLYFATKEDLFRAIVRQELVQSLELAEQAIKNYKGESGDLLRMIVGRFLAVMATDLAVIPKLVLSEAGNFPEIAKFYADEVVARGMKLIGGILERGIASGEFRPIDSAQFVPIFIGPMLMMVLWKHSIGRHTAIGFDHAAVLDAHIGMMLRGLVPDPPA